jgi:hypothetical protein
MAHDRGHRPRRMFLAVAGTAGAALLVRRDGVQAASPAAGLAAVEARQAAERAGLCSAANAAGVGLRGEYFAAERCAGAPLLVRLDGAIDFDGSFDLPAGSQARARSVRWSGWVKPPLSGRYRFHAGSPDARIVVARQPLAGPDAAPDVELSAGRFYPILVEVDRIAAAEARIRLEWTAPHGARFLVPRALLYLPTEGLVPSRTA